MGMFSHNIYENVRTRVIVLHKGSILLLPIDEGRRVEGRYWLAPGGGLEPNESLAECARREVLEETGIVVQVGRVAFLLEWVVPKYTPALEEGGKTGYTLNIFYYAYPEEPIAEPHAEFPELEAPRWFPLSEAASLPLYPKELKMLCQRLAEGKETPGCITTFGKLESPWTQLEHDPFA